MTEAASQLDLQVLMDDGDSNRLVPSIKKKPMYSRNGTQVFLGILVVGLLATLVTWLRQDFNPTYYPPFLIIILTIMVIRREQIKGIYILTDTGIKLPYTWFYRRQIPFENVIQVSDDTITNEETGQSHAAIRIIVDSELIKLNLTGMQSPNILLSTIDYDSMDLNQFADEIVKKKREIAVTPNTLAQRLTDQVNRAWKNRWKLILLNVFDSSSESLIYILLIDSLIFGFIGVSIWPIFGGILLVLYSLLVFIIQFFNKPQAIVGLRPHELGPLIYDEEELITSVRFIIMCHPYTVELKDCEVIYPEGASKQVGRLDQIQPPDVPPGELTYAVAQLVGNHSKATGAKIQFTYKESDRDLLYEVPIEWG